MGQKVHPIGFRLGVIEGCTNPESAEMLADGETFVFGNCALGVGFPWFRDGAGLVYLEGQAFVSRARVGANGDRTMMLVYNLPSVDTLYQRYLGVNGSAYVVAGLGMTVLPPICSHSKRTA